MKRFLTTLMILLVVIVAGLSALILLVNPNDFRGWMVQEVEERSGYQLNIEGPLRWHVWPQLSILSGRMSLTAPGASQPIVSAENMRLDVALYPLLSHQLQVKQVMVKDTVVKLIPESQPQEPANSPVAPQGSSSSSTTDRGWSFAIDKLKVVDSVLVFQRADKEQITVRGINLEMQQDASKKAHIELSSRINRDQRDLTFSLLADVDFSDYPHTLNASVSSLNYQLQGADLLAEGIKGSGDFSFTWQEEKAAQKLDLNITRFTANDSDLKGEISYTLGDIAELAVNLQSRKLNLDNLLITDTRSGQPVASSNPPRPVIAHSPEPDYQTLRTQQADISLAADTLQWRGLNVTGLQTSLTNRKGLLKIETLNGQIGNGSLSLPGTLDVRGSQAKYSFQPQFRQIEVGTLLSAFNYPVVVTGLLSLNGSLSGNALSASDFREHWQGNAQIDLSQALLQGMNFQQLIQQAVSRSASGISIPGNDDNITSLDSLSARMRLNNGSLQLSSMSGHSNILTLTGSGTLNIVQEVCDVMFHIRVNGGWQGSNNKLIKLLERASVPLRIYGPWQQLSYSLPIDQVLRDLLQGEVKQRLNEWLDKRTEQEGVEDIKRLLKDF
ncbi:outer membrane assembly protein AsmA [uncultured Cedecea sp.]|uniref:outer membrane assembly protein AsmA n=1 Tax=uncultured Cedecea sp. TaxID=988762 RepID=UPI002621F395|nr:outer membrane assembly protein AsmA [uncultured Cedecea sp.]